MEKVTIDELDPSEAPMGRYSVSEALGAEDYSMNYYVLEPGEEFSGGMHAHLDQEESFLVLEGTATFETKPEPTADSDTVTVGEDEIIRFEAGEYQQGRNESDETVRALALGTPQESTDVRVAAPCVECGETEYLVFTMVGGAPATQCPECGAEFEV